MCTTAAKNIDNSWFPNKNPRSSTVDEMGR